jgi:hypothetical protein
LLIVLGSSSGCSPSVSSVNPSPAVSASAVPQHAPCLTTMSAAWTEFLTANEVRIADANLIAPFAVSLDGTRLFATYLGQPSGVISMDRLGQSRIKISTFRTNPDGVIGGDFDGRWLVWSENHSATSFSDWSLSAFDTVTGQSVLIGSAPRVGGDAIPGPLVFPVVEHGFVAWTQSVPSGDTQLHLYNLESRSDDVVPTNHPGAPTISWPWLVWQEPIPQSADEALRAISIPSLASANLPSGLKSIRSATYMAGAPGALAWIAKDLRSVWLWKTGWTMSKLVYQAPVGDYAEFISTGSTVVAWNSVESSYLLDERTEAVTALTSVPTFPHVRGEGLVYNYATSQGKSPIRSERLFLVPTKGLPPLHAC